MRRSLSHDNKSWTKPNVTDCMLKQCCEEIPVEDTVASRQAFASRAVVDYSYWFLLTSLARGSISGSNGNVE